MSYLQYCSIRQFNMVTHSGQFDCFCMGYFISKYNTGKKGIIISLLSLSIFIVPYLFLLNNFIMVKEIFSVGTLVAAASIVFLDHNRRFYPYRKNKEIRCSWNHFFIGNSIYVYSQQNAVEIDCRACS